ncbi:HTL1 (YCR020W-B) [Zygosaccharomyces parabailii]|uniref:ZYBA0S06-02234g1_1 n=1 Tax=Zygosaccharomyces bailii (strain CLIB 213 / ATCC 58445 / CBS 680 / BCRC 21525 / NBRC 1098 / NCYC 1416 / NRRL Y-2227) TaxID=1333698 RepID=A0A8J2X1F0_ZYGB2|nr:HTL1 (YCR020W-B) [Zygosaccharomyces parabailii]CDF90167.1 ZYBA0S06-02234g1_1 [Zygosaccharomyces bailii CLIB 213]
MTFEKLTRKKLVLHKNSLNIMENIDMSNQSTQRKHSNITLKTLTAYQLMSQRERMCELFQLLDDSERHDRIVNPAAQDKLLQSTRQSLQDLKTDLAQN